MGGGPGWMMCKLKSLYMYFIAGVPSAAAIIAAIMPRRSSEPMSFAVGVGAAAGAIGLAVILKRYLDREPDDPSLPPSVCPGVCLSGKDPAQTETVQAQTSSGVVVGFRRGRDAAHFRGVPFAAPTEGINRWKAPQQCASWTTPLDCTAYGEACREPEKAIQAFMKSFGKDVTTAEAIGAMGDKCLNLNIVTPSTSGKAPVMVWIHGGSNTFSSNHGNCVGWSPTTSERFAQEGIVSVSVNFRQNMHGFAHFPELGITNLALRDLIASLEWVQREIGVFGGDASNVTIYGESAGGIAVSMLLACPTAAHLFHKAVVQSGAYDPARFKRTSPTHCELSRGCAWRTSEPASTTYGARAPPFAAFLRCRSTTTRNGWRPTTRRHSWQLVAPLRSTGRPSIA